MLTIEEIKARATSKREALLVSKEVWTERAQASEKELKQTVLSSNKCGLCHYYGFVRGSGHGDCPLHDIPGRACCSEYNTASDVFDAREDGEKTLSEVRAAFWSMVARLDRELAKLPVEEKKEEPKLKYWDYGYDKDGEDFWISTLKGIFWIRDNSEATFKREEMLGRMGNLKDDLAALQEDVGKKFEIKQGNQPSPQRITVENYGDYICFEGRHTHLSLEQTEEIILKLRQMVATAKRKQLCKENKK